MRLIVLAAALAVFAAASPARAGQSYDNCSGFIDSVPATISTQGVWCLRADVSTAIANGNAITVATNNVTIDCNGFKLGGLAAGTSSDANGILSTSLNTTVRNCNIRGFYAGVFLQSEGGHLVVSNRFDGNLGYGIFVLGEGSVIRDNSVLDTGGSDDIANFAVGIYSGYGTDIIGNLVLGVSANDAGANTYGIYTSVNSDGSVRDNRIKRVLSIGGGQSVGIYNANSGRIIVRNNDIQGLGEVNSIGIRCQNNVGTAYGNIVSGYETAIFGCSLTGNFINAN